MKPKFTGIFLQGAKLAEWGWDLATLLSMQFKDVSQIGIG